MPNFERVLLDIEVQRDFFALGGSCFNEQGQAAAFQIARLFHWARVSHVPVISTVLRVRSNEIGPLSDVPHCIEGTEGEEKLPRTIMPRHINLGLRNSTDLPDDIFDHYQQVIFEKRNTNIFAHARAERLLTELPRTTFIICGAGAACGILQAAVGLRSRDFAVIIASDAVGELGDPRAEMAYRCMEAKGVIFARTAQIVNSRPAPVRAYRQVVQPG